MLTRRLLRIKVFQTIYSYQQQEGATLFAHEKNLLSNIESLGEIYLHLLKLPAELNYYIDNDHNTSNLKYLPSEKDLKTNQAFLDNPLIKRLAESNELHEKTKRLKRDWYKLHKDTLFNIFSEFKNTDFFKEYITRPEWHFADHKEFLMYFYKEFLPKYETFEHLMEEIHLNWNDDKIPVWKTLVKTIESMEEDGKGFQIISLSKALEEDIEFGKDLLKKTISQDKELESLIAAKTPNWETDRIALTDLILMKMAVCEMLNFPLIPIKVTINEYLEIAKVYSTPNSNKFLNGILDKILIDLKNENKIQKQGRGLIE